MVFVSFHVRAGFNVWSAHHDILVIRISESAGCFLAGLHKSEFDHWNHRVRRLILKARKSTVDVELGWGEVQRRHKYYSSLYVGVLFFFLIVSYSEKLVGWQALSRRVKK